VGTILHMDSLLERLMPNESQKTTQRNGLKTYSTAKGMWKAIKFRAHNEDFTELLWPQKKSAAEFRLLYDEAVKDGTTDIYSQEYLNYPLDESVAYFRKADFVNISDEEKKAPLRYYLTADLAISESDKADYSVFVIAGIDENRIVHIKDVIRERIDGREIVDLILSLQRVYEFQQVGIEEMQVSKAIKPFLYEEMVRTNTYPSLVPLKHGGKDKVMRSRSIQARMRAHSIRFNKEADWYPIFENECLTFPRGKHDDQVDAFAYLGMMLDKLVEAPTQEEMDEDAYRDELYESGTHLTGRSSITGY
jgi:predicted phage terminase large subunit-like protein